MKRNILILFAVVSLLISLTGCGSSGHSNSVAPTPTTMTTLRVSLTQNGQPATGAEVTLYTPAAAMREGMTKAQSYASPRASIGLNNNEGVYSPTLKSNDGTYTFTVPTGEYTLVASKGASRAVVTNLRAEDSTPSSIQVAELKPTGTVSGTVKAPSGVSDLKLGGIFVYLENTSLVAFTNSDGSFTITGVPLDITYPIAAMTSQNGKFYKTSSENTVTIYSSSSSEYTLPNVELNLDNTNPFLYTITATVTNATDNTAYMVTNGVDLYAGKVNKGGFSVKVKTVGEYVVSVFGSNEGSRNVTVSEENTTVPDFTMPTSTVEYSCVKGNIEFSSEYKDTLGKVPEAERYLVQLIGVDGNTYRTQTRSDYYYSETSTFVFDNVYPGTYTVFVDPAGNGFVGSIGTFTVKAGETKDLGQTATATVAFIQPVSEISPDSSCIFFFEKCPYISVGIGTTTVLCRKIGANTSPIRLNLFHDTDNNNYHLQNDSTDYVLPSNGKYEFIVQRTWEDSNTGLSGILTETQVKDYVGATGFIGSVNVVYLANDDNALNNKSATYSAEIYYETVDDTPKEFIRIKENDVCIATLSYPIELEYSTPQFLYNVQILKDGRYYFEASCPDNGNFKKFIFIFKGENTYSLALANRINCVMDEYGFIYRFDDYTKRIIKVNSLEGEPKDYIETKIDNLRPEVTSGIGLTVGLDFNNSTLYYWKYKPVE